jgi:hypothetical protein
LLAQADSEANHCTFPEGVGEEGAEEDIWAKMDEVTESGEDYTTKSFMVCTPHQTLFG